MASERQGKTKGAVKEKSTDQLTNGRQHVRGGWTSTPRPGDNFQIKRTIRLDASEIRRSPVEVKVVYPIIYKVFTVYIPDDLKSPDFNHQQ